MGTNHKLYPRIIGYAVTTNKPPKVKMTMIADRACITSITEVTYQSAVRVVSRKSISNPRDAAFFSI